MLVVGSALAFAATGYVLGWQARAGPGLVFCALLVGVTAIDLRYRIVPNRLVAIGTPLGLALQLSLTPERWLELVLATLAAFLVLFAVAVFSPGGMGMGDVKLAAMLGAFLGRAVSVALMSGLLLAAVPSILVLARFGVKGGRKETLPLGPFLALGGLLGAALRAQPARLVLGRAGLTLRVFGGTFIPFERSFTRPQSRGR